MKVEFIIPTESDLIDLQVVHNKAFLADYLKYGSCPGYGRTIKSLRESMYRNKQFKIVADGRTVGKISAHMDGETAHLDCLCVIPEYENNGLGQKAVAYMEQQFPLAKKWSLETPKDKTRNVAFYEKCGYFIEGEIMEENTRLVILVKHKEGVCHD